jgi:TRAP-type transport system periplasmic protein
MRIPRSFVLGVVVAGAVAASACSAPAVAAEHTIRIGLIAAAGQPIELGAKEFQKIVEAGSKGRIAVQIFPGGQLGGEIQLQDSVMIGTIQMANIGTPVMSGKLKKLDILNMYYLWRNRAHMKAVLEGPIGTKLFAEYSAKSGADVIAANWQQGTRETLLKRRAANRKELGGVKIRVTAGVPIYDELWKGMGASPVPLAFPEAYSAMQTGVVDGVEIPPDFMVAYGFYNLGKFMIKTDHYIYTNVMIVNHDFFAGLPADLQDLVKRAAIEAGEYQTKLVLDLDLRMIDKLRSSGVEIVDADASGFAASVQPVFEKNMGIWGRDLYDQITAAGR